MMLCWTGHSNLVTQYARFREICVNVVSMGEEEIEQLRQLSLLGNSLAQLAMGTHIFSLKITTLQVKACCAMQLNITTTQLGTWIVRWILWGGDHWQSFHSKNYLRRKHIFVIEWIWGHLECSSEKSCGTSLMRSSISPNLDFVVRDMVTIGMGIWIQSTYLGKIT